VALGFASFDLASAPNRATALFRSGIPGAPAAHRTDTDDDLLTILQSSDHIKTALKYGRLRVAKA
jgi:hypothetical protein